MKPLGQKSYGSIPHLPGSRLGPGDHHCHAGQSDIATIKARDKHDVIIVQKLDGSCCAIANVDGQILALGRAGYLAQTSKFEQHQLFAHWVRTTEDRWRELIQPGERCCGEWMAQAHGTRYQLSHEPFVVFDLMQGMERATWTEITHRLQGRVVLPRVISEGPPCSIGKALEAIKTSAHGAIDPVEGAVWHVERHGAVDFLCKYVRPDKVDGCFLPEVSGLDPVWHWRP